MIAIREMLEAGIHFGHHTRYWNPKMRPFIYAAHHKLHIIDLEQTAQHLKEVCQIVEAMALQNKNILFVGTKRTAKRHIKEQAIRCGMPYVNERWLGGMLTNHQTIRQSVVRLANLEMQSQDGTFDKLTKKEALGLERRMNKLDRAVGGIKEMKGLPHALFVLDIRHEKIAVTEANKLGIPIIGIVDTNSDPDTVDHIIPGNDDSIRSALLYTKTIADAIIEGSAKRESTAPPAEAEEKVEHAFPVAVPKALL